MSQSDIPPPLHSSPTEPAPPPSEADREALERQLEEVLVELRDHLPAGWR